LEKREQLEAIAQELLEKEIIFKADLERLIGLRPFEDKHHEPVIKSPDTEEKTDAVKEETEKEENTEELKEENHLSNNGQDTEVTEKKEEIKS
jgi:cell division protease FtsH